VRPQIENVLVQLGAHVMVLKLPAQLPAQPAPQLKALQWYPAGQPAVHLSNAAQLHKSQAPQEHVGEHVREVQVSQAEVSPGVHSPSPLHAPKSSHRHDSLHVRLRLPQRPQTPSSVSPAAHSPSLEQVLHAPHPQPALQKRSRLPQLPQASDSRTPGSQVPAAVPHARHIPSTHSPPPGQGVPGQQAAPGVPQPWHCPASHEKPVAQAFPRQQG